MTDRLWLRTVAGLFAGLVAAAAIVLYLGISQRELVASLHGIADEPLFLAALGGLVLMALQALRWWVVMRPVLELNYGQAFRALGDASKTGRFVAREWSLLEEERRNLVVLHDGNSRRRLPAAARACLLRE